MTMTTTNEEMKVPDIQALIRFGKWGFWLLASRVLSLVALVGLLALAGYVAYSPSWQGAAVVAVVALAAFIPSLKTETRQAAPKGE